MRNDGTIDTDNMRSATRDKLKAALSDASLHERIGLSKPRSASDGALPAEFNLHVASILHDTLSKLVAVMVMKSGYPPEQAKQMLLTAEEKQTLDPLLGNVLNDWLPTIEGKYQSLALLGAGYFSVYNTKALMLRKPAEVIPFPQAESVQVDAQTDAPSP